MRRLAWAVLCGGASMLPAPVHAQAELDLAWEAPAGCPQREFVRERIRTLAGETARKAEPLRASGRIEQTERGYRLTLMVRERGEIRSRTMSSTSCVDLAGAAAVALGLLLRQGPDASATDGKPGEAGASGAAGERSGSGAASEKDTRSNAPSPTRPDTPAAKRPSKQEDDSSAEPPQQDDVASDRRWALVLRAPLAALEVGALPKPNLALGGGVGLRSNDWRAVVSGRAGFGQSWLLDNPAGVGAKVGRWHAQLSVCRGWRMGPWELAPCLAVGAARFWARGTGSGVTARAQQSISLVLGAAGAAHLRVFDELAIFATIGAEVDTAPPHLIIERIGEIGQVRPVQFFTGVGPEWIF